MLRLPYHPRALNKIWAHIFGYFWLPCPLCGRNFGGHEWREPTPSIPTSTCRAKGVCPRSECVKEARRLTREFYDRPDIREEMHRLIDVVLSGKPKRDLVS